MKHAFLLFFFLHQVCVFAQSRIHFEDIPLHQALEESRKYGKPVFFMAYASWCTHCKNMKEQVFTQDSVADFFNAHFICMMMDMEQGDGIDLHNKFKINSYPTFVFLDSTGQVIYQVAGELDGKGFIQEGRNVFKRELQLPYLRQQFEANVTDTNACLKYLFGLNHARLPTMSVVHTYFAAQNSHPPITIMNWRILNAGVSNITSVEYQYIIDHRKEFAAIMTEIKLERKLFRTAVYHLQPLVNLNDTLAYFNDKKVIAGLNIYPLDSVVFIFDLTIFDNNNQWLRYENVAVEHTRDYAWDDYSQLQHIATQFFARISDQQGLVDAAGWARRSAELKPEYGNTLLYAELLEKAGNRADAKVAAENARRIAAATSAPAIEADLLLQRLTN